MEKAKRYGIIAVLLIILGLVGQSVFNRTQNGGQEIKDLTDLINLRNDCTDGDKKACEQVKKLEKKRQE
jgi:hypothetical protein